MGNGKTALVLGATGGIGGETAAALMQQGWKVVAMARAGRPAADRLDPRLADIAWIAGDAMDATDVARAAAGAEVIVHAVNPPGYRNWGKLVLPMIDNSIAAAKAVGARLVLPGTIYNYGPDAFPNLDERSAENPVTTKGKIRVELERRMETASREGMTALIMRFGDFFGPVPGNNWFAQGLVKPGTTLKSSAYPGRRGVGHAWAYLPDAGEAIARVLDRGDALAPFARFHFGGHWDDDGSKMIQAISTVLGRPVPVRPFPWLLLRIIGWFQETPREIVKMRYLWREPLRLDNRRLVEFIGTEPHTPLRDAVRDTLVGLAVR
jgi:nucleoside-diphosphate-sugar epimerase